MLQHDLRGDRRGANHHFGQASLHDVRDSGRRQTDLRKPREGDGGRRFTAAVECPTHPLTHPLTHVTVFRPASFFRVVP